APFNMLEVARSVGGFLSRLDETASKLNAAILDVRRLVLNEPTLTNLAVAVSNIRLVSEHALTTVDNLNALVETNSPSIALAVSNLVFFSQEINQFARELSGALTTNTTDLARAMKNIESSTAVLKTL